MARPIRIVLALGALLAAALPAVSRAADAPLVIAGGALDSEFYGAADVYRGVPAAAKVPPGRACAMAQRYVDLINAGQFDRIADLFEADAVVMEPMRTIDRGHDQIHAFYDRRMRQTPPQIVAVALVGDETDCMLEIAARRTVRGAARYALVSVDHFKLGASGRFSRMVAFARPPRTE